MTIGVQNASATTASFPLEESWFFGVVDATAWNSGSVALQIQSGDGTWCNVQGATYTSNGAGAVLLRAGTYRLAIVSATGVTASLSEMGASA